MSAPDTGASGADRPRPSPRPRLAVVPDPPPDPPADPPATPPAATHSRISTIWYHLRIWTLAVAALIVVAFMASAILLSTFPRLGGPSIAPLFRPQQPATLPPRDFQQERQRWPYVPDTPMNPVAPGRGPTGP